MATRAGPVIWIVRVSVLFGIGLTAFVLLAPYAPDGSWVEVAGQNLRDVMAAWWGQPIR